MFGGASPIFRIDTKTKSEDEVAWLDDASMKVGERSKLNLMSLPVVTQLFKCEISSRSLLR